jgi:hypothetical protein
MIYNTQKKKLIMPEYGRNIQNMVDHCVMLEDRGERKRCAYAVVDIMGSMFPHLRDVNDFKHILWDHLAIMSDFKLDIDYPYEVVTREDLTTAPEKLNYSRPTMRFRHYGKLLERMIAIAADMEDGEKRDLLISQLTTQMKKSYSQWNKEVDDEKILADLVELSGGKIQLDYENYSIADVKNPASKRRLKTIKSQRRK